MAMTSETRMATVARPPVGERTRKRFTLAVAMFGFAVVTLDAQATNVALPSIHRAFGGGLSGLQWIVTGYTLMFSSLLLFGGSVADRIGSRNAYRNGMLLFVAASAACGLAPSLPFLVVARFVQGAGAALVTPTSLSLIREAYEDAGERTRAIALWALGGSIAAAAGPVLGGLLTEISWRLIFFINLPIGVAAVVALRQVAVSPERPVRFDWLGQVAAVVTLAGLTYGCIEGGSIGFAQTQVIAAFALSVVGLVVFLIDQVHSDHPMIPLHIFRSRMVSLPLTVAFITMAGFYGTVFLQSLYFQQLRGRSAIETGLLFLPMTGMVALTNSFVANIIARLGPIAPIVAGQLLMAAGLVVLAVVPAHASLYLVSVLMILVGVGGVLTVPPIASLIMDGVEASLAGTASGVLNAFRQMGGSLGVAAFGALIDATGHFETGLRIDYLAAAVIVALGAVATAALRLQTK